MNKFINKWIFFSPEWKAIHTLWWWTRAGKWLLITIKLIAANKLYFSHTFVFNYVHPSHVCISYKLYNTYLKWLFIYYIIKRDLIKKYSVEVIIWMKFSYLIRILILCTVRLISIRPPNIIICVEGCFYISVYFILSPHKYA